MLRLSLSIILLAPRAMSYTFFRPCSPDNNTVSCLAYGIPGDESQPVNATGRIEFKGPDLSKAPTNDFELNESWTATLNFTYIPIPDDDDVLNVPWVLKTSLGLQQPDSMNGTDPGWMPCVTVYEFFPSPNSSYVEQAEQSTSSQSCQPYIGSECSSDINKGLQALISETGSCEYAKEPNVCKVESTPNDHGGSGEFDGATMEMTSANYRGGVQFFETSFGVGIFGDDDELNTAYDREATGAYAVHIIWASQTSGDGEREEETTFPHTQFCISATDFAPGSRVPDDPVGVDDEDNSAAFLGGPFGTVPKTLLAVVATSLALLV